MAAEDADQKGKREIAFAELYAPGDRIAAAKPVCKPRCQLDDYRRFPA
jgi:hypothetical protein